jgi:hypothetical protein
MLPGSPWAESLLAAPSPRKHLSKSPSKIFYLEVLNYSSILKPKNKMTITNIIGGVLFGGIGFVAFIYGKKQANLKAMIIGALLMVYPYLTPNTIALYCVGIVLTLALFIFR